MLGITLARCTQCLAFVTCIIKHGYQGAVLALQLCAWNYVEVAYVVTIFEWSERERDI